MTPLLTIFLQDFDLISTSRLSHFFKIKVMPLTLISLILMKKKSLSLIY